LPIVQVIESRNFPASAHVRFWHKADITIAPNHVRFWGKADIALDRRRQAQAIPDQETGGAPSSAE
jgi:hypothetical protein